MTEQAMPSSRDARRARSALLTSLVVFAATLLGPADAAAEEPAIVVDPAQPHQRVDGFGFSEAFQRSNIMHGSEGLSPENQRRVLDLLFDTESGAGFSILRNGIGSSPDNSFDHMRSIAPTDPGGPDAEPQYIWDGSDNSQVWLAQEAMRYGVDQIYADAWSAPGYMKTNGIDSNGGELCGMPGTSCPSGDWRQAYADYLVQYLRFYQQEGIPISHVGFLNEPDLTTDYASMLATGAQAADFLKVLGPTLRKSGLDTKLACCDATGWQDQAEMLAAIQADPAASAQLDVVTGHGYASPPSEPLRTDLPVWQSEWANFDPWTPAWDDQGVDGEGLVWANRIQQAFTEGNVSAFFHWWGASASTANSGLIRLQGDSVEVSKRLWAFAQFSRFVRPDAVRLGARSSIPDVSVSAFRNVDGSIAVQLINNGHQLVTEEVRVPGANGNRIQPYLTDNAHDVAELPPIQVRGDSFEATLPARSIITYQLPARR
ncbi:hypothetical protein MOQ72_10390 [Saccharopolyspora sp. K220]|uniref:glycoside hydrolase family 30 protein n=1 Tax=Saccharopolyspora soli TaxID=2926618 RepID=UPI001F560ACE|nr:glycoside hydrolase [Saccharopolyspora soli]MCI2417832.1 hypothetical protein [Saccharopolyspora soli]